MHIWLFTILGALLVGLYTGQTDMYNLAFLAMGLTFSIVVFIKGREFGFDTVRGRFLLIGAPVGILIGLAVVLNNSILHILFRLFILSALIFMFINLSIKLRIPLKGTHLFMAGSFGILILIMMLAVMHEAPLRNWFTMAIALIDTKSLVFIVLNFMIYMGGDIAKEWLFRTISIMVLIIGDIAFLLDMSRKLGLRIELLLWFLPFFVMSNVLIYAE